MMRCVLICMLWMPLSFASSQHPPQSTVYRMFWHPMMKGERLNYCNEDKSACGKKIADCYCKANGYEKSSRFNQAPNIGLTRFVSGKNECQGWKCSGFDYVECKGERKYHSRPLSDYRQALFSRPRWKNLPLAWCYSQNHKNCGYKAAYAFCRWQGYGKVIKHSVAKCVDATKQIGTGAICVNDNCKGFEYIICGRK